MGVPPRDHTAPAPGYSMAVLRKACGLSYVAGAPRHKQRGAVFELQKEGRETRFMPVLEGEQVPAGEGPWDPPHYYSWASGGPRGKGMGSRAHSRLGTQPGQNSGTTQTSALVLHV